MKHTIAKYFAAAAALCLTAVGCSTLQEDKGVSENRDIRFSASIGSFQVKATDTAFENGDAIGLYAGDHVKAENVRLDWKDGALTPETPVQWGFNQLVDESTLFSAYYPYTAEPQIATDEGGLYLAFSVQKDQSTHAAYTASDLMTASTYATPAEGTVNFTFIHRLSKLVLTVDNRLNDPVKEVYVGNVYTEGIYDIVHSQDYGSTGEPSSVKACEGVTAAGEKAWSVIIPSQSCLITLTLVTESGKEYTYKSEYNVYFAAARRYTAQVILDETAISTSFSANVYDWIDNGDFWFKQPNPLYDGPWSIVGTVYGSNWDTDFYMDRVDNAVWHYTLAYHEGELFKFRYDSGWSYDYGIEETKPLEEGIYTLVLGGQGGQNIQLSRSGIYNVYLDLENSVMYVWWAGELPTVEGTIIWEGNQPLSEWAGHQLGSEKAWIDNGAQIGNVVRVYYEANNSGKFQVWSGHWENWGLDYFVESGAGYVSFVINDYIYSCMTSIDDWGGALTVQGDGVTITAVTLTEYQMKGWTLIGSIMGTSWDKDFEMSSYADWGLNCWSIDIDYQAGDSFKFRKDGDWTENLGVGGQWTDNQDGSYTMILAPDMDNITLPKEGKWSLWLDVDNRKLTATYQSSGGQPSAGTESQPFNVYQAIEYINGGGADQVFVEGIISKIVYTFNANYGTATFWISRDGKYYNDLSQDFEAYSVYWLGNTSWVDGNQQIEVGDKVILCGQLTKYNDSTYETVSKKAYIHAIGKNVWDPARTTLDYWYSSSDWSGTLIPSIEKLDNGFTIVVPDNIGGQEWMGQNRIYNPFNPKGDKYYHLEGNLYSQNYNGSICSVKLAEYNNDVDHVMAYWNDIKLSTNNGYASLYPLYSGADYSNGLLLILDLGRCKAGEIVTISDIKLFEF